MSVVDAVADKVKPVVGEKVSPSSGLMKYFVEYLQKPETGGLEGFVKKFETAGLGPQVQSWIGTGTKLPITPDEVTRALGSAEIAQMATKAGISTQDTSQQLTQLLPDAINHLTPTGKLPAPAVFGELLGSLKGKFSI